MPLEALMKWSSSMTTIQKTMVISQLPLNVVGGGELFTIRSFQQLLTVDSACELWFSEQVQDPQATHRQRMQQVYVCAHVDGEQVTPVARQTLQQLANRLPDFEAVAVHQYLSAGSSLDIIAALAPDQLAILTSLGHEPFAGQFQRTFEPAGNVHVVEISEYAAQRSLQRGIAAVGIAAGIFERNISSPKTHSKRSACRAVSVGRLLPHKGFDVTISGLPDSWSLKIVGPPSCDRVYETHLAQLVHRNPRVRSCGFLPVDEREQEVRSADVLIASSCQTLYDGRHLEQAELFGLVLLEAVAAGVLPIASDLPSFREIMESLGLSEFIYPQRDASSLRELLTRVGDLSRPTLESILREAQSKMREAYLWETYWPRIFEQALGTGRPALSNWQRRAA